MNRAHLFFAALSGIMLSSANAQEITLPDVITQVPERSIQGTDPAKKTLIIKQENSVVPVVTRSLMFNSSDASQLESAVLSYIDNAILNKNNIAVTAKPLTPSIKQIYFGSVIYRSGKDSLAWVNGEKFAAGQTIKAFTVLDIKKEQVTVKWNIGQLSLGSKDALAKNGILLQESPQERSVTFTLNINQRLDVDKMKILSGKLAGALTVPVVQMAEPGALSNTPLEGSAVEEFVDVPASSLPAAPEALKKAKESLQNLKVNVPGQRLVAPTGALGKDPLSAVNNPNPAPKGTSMPTKIFSGDAPTGAASSGTGPMPPAPVTSKQ